MAGNLSKMKKDEKDLEGGLIATCRICLQCDGEEDEGLISPCMCKGTQQFVHRSCLDRWRSVKDGFGFLHCTTCKAQFHLRVVQLRKTKFKLSAAGQLIITYLAIHIVSGMLGGLAYLVIHKHGYLKDLLNDDGELLSHPLFCFCVGVIMLTALLSLFAMIFRCCTREDFFSELYTTGPCVTILVYVFMPMFILPCLLTTMVKQQRRHYWRELTKEYVVEDLNGCYSTPPELDPVHMERLIVTKAVVTCNKIK